MADRLLTLHEEGLDPKTAKNVTDNIKWWLSRRKWKEFGDKLVVEDERHDLVRTLQSAMNRLIVAAQAPQALTVIEVEAKPAVAIRRFTEDPVEKHRP
jgi:hypothetical protein